MNPGICYMPVAVLISNFSTAPNAFFLLEGRSYIGEVDIVRFLIYKSLVDFDHEWGAPRLSS